MAMLGEEGVGEFVILTILEYSIMLFDHKHEARRLLFCGLTLTCY